MQTPAPFLRQTVIVSNLRPSFTVARNPEADSKLPYLVRLPIEGGLVLKARDSWPRSARVYCHPFDAPWPEEPELSSIKRPSPCADDGDRPSISSSTALAWLALSSSSRRRAADL
jgi:hypothetical protein